ncbi:heparanase-like isoform X2 [Venturia canescens]|uniref:heparanase-like isoform X2 n=1 Tax=Venturia canescens TaxID=32260 RepID=UPI001C9CF5BC|nr:heparanase-like isoform X2 [Venturia canescens]
MYSTVRSVVTSLIVALCMALLILFFWDVSRHSAKTHVFVIDTSQPILYTTSEKFLSFGLDSSLLRHMKNFPIKDEKFVNLARHLSPAYVRFGGTSADCLFFNETSFDFSTNTTSPVDGQDISNFTITENDFLDLYKFTEKSDLRMMFDLNVLIRLPDGTWDYNNAQEIIDFAKSRNMLVDWQLGNEPNSFPHAFGRTVTAEQLGRDYSRLRAILNLSGYQPSILVGPEVNHIGDENHHAEEYAKVFLENNENSVDYFTWHQYYLNGRQAHVKDFINPSTFKYLAMQIEGINTMIKSTGQKIKMWLSETSTAYGGGAPELSDRFVAGFLWLDKLGYSATTGVAVVVRQSLFGGNYAMVGPDITPNPDWWVSVLYKQLVSKKVLRLVTANDSPTVRLYAHCTPESALINRVPAITLYGMNIDAAPAKISIQRIQALQKKGATVFLYILTASHLQSSEIRMNGETLKLKPDGTLPPFKPIILDLSHSINLPGYSMIFMTIHGADVPACKT